MSYARWGAGSDVYVYADVGGGVVCCCCSLEDGDTVRCWTAELMAEHLRKHVEAGHRVCPGTIEQVLDDAAFIEANGDQRMSFSVKVER